MRLYKWFLVQLGLAYTWLEAKMYGNEFEAYDPRDIGAKIVSFSLAIIAFGLMLLSYPYYWFLCLVFRYPIEEPIVTELQAKWCVDNKLMCYNIYEGFTNSVFSEEESVLALGIIFGEKPGPRVPGLRFFTEAGLMAYKLRWME